MTLYDSMTMPLYQKEREREQLQKLFHTFANFFKERKFLKQSKVFQLIQISQNFYTFQQTLTLFTFVYLCLPLFLFKGHIYSQIVYLFYFDRHSKTKSVDDFQVTFWFPN